MSKFQSIKGMKDILPADVASWQHSEAVMRRVLEAYGYREIRLPLIEKTELFARSIGTQTDIVGKEMYTFTDRDGDSITLRPEGTAGCVRAGIQHGLFHKQQQRLYYLGPMFRHERPQRGRHRQFHQIGAEAVGWEGPDIDAEMILLVSRIWRELGVDDINLEINSLGDHEARQRYRQRLVDFLSRYESQLDQDSQKRLKTNPLRVLDSKDERTKKIIDEAPNILDSLDSYSRTHFEALQEYLSAAGIQYRVNSHLVRGLDYYWRTVFEWSSSRLGAQGTVCAGGRYDGLVEELGGKSTPAIGFALGFERLVELLSSRTNETGVDVYLVILGSIAKRTGLVIAEELRDAGLNVISHCGESGIKSQMKRADKSNAHVAILVGEDELKSGTFVVKPLRSNREQISVAKERLLEAVRDVIDRSAVDENNPSRGVESNG
jgi:histidyl-tRNA synthetase